MTTDAQKRASQKWRQRNKERVRYSSDKAAAKRFIGKADKTDLVALREQVEQRLKELNQNPEAD
ncbi:hypothetical protein GPK34_00260 [Secundilactobacillus kimchicus]|uniref:hypothetical protein n=1 Tax=Secundilactobacillus kimchicus TaxID=528209 RepID=UPI001C011E05|nr:hypothetical protein [Secundilactobacillus kimchicus]MBT9670469.1 hypothetical protein [Secundilactobacillus kimchicus]